MFFTIATGFRGQAQSFDFGDAPDSYGTRLNSNGPRHIGFSRVYLGGGLGSAYDTEPDGQPNSQADGDDTHDQYGNLVSGQSDEDGLVKEFPAVCVSREKYSLQIRVYNNSGQNATVSAWIDINKNGVFDPNERTQAVVPTTPNQIHYNGTDVTLVWTGFSGQTAGWTYARLRVATNPDEVANPTGLASDGEVEDYRVQIKDEFDFGDAPACYGTFLKDNGARHMINNNVMLLGPLDCSADDDGQPTTLADGDAGENSVGFPYRLSTAKTVFSANVNVLNTSGADAMLSGWVDFNRNGVFDASERAQAVINPDTRNVVLTWTGLSGLTVGRTYARFRVATDAAEVADPTGSASNGSVEDYTLMIEEPQYDFGDAPDSYGTLLGSNGARHIYNDVSTKLCLSDGLIAGNVDAEADGQPTAQATGDDALSTDGFPSPFRFDDETGLWKSPVLTTSSTSCSAVLSLRNQTGANATVSGWIDINRNGVFDPDERAQATVPYNQDGSLVQVQLYWNNLTGLTTGTTFMRFRVASSADEVANPTGVASDGEVEDYTLTIAPGNLGPMPVDLVLFQGQWIEPKGNQLNWVTAWEKDNDHFDIQRSSDAKSFETIGRVAGKGTSSTNQSYQYIDEEGKQANLFYYRLRQVDQGGKANFSRIIAIRHDAQPVVSMTVYPNPTTDVLNIRLDGSQLSGIRIYTIAGVEVLSQTGVMETVDVRNLPSGVYVIEIQTAGGQVVRQRFVKR
ncbi:GEVED domain-containing protein [Spirosoma koreense]